MTNEGSFLSHLRIKGSGADGIYRMVMKLAILSIWLKPTLGVQRVVSNHTFILSPTDKVPLTPKNGVPVLNSSECALATATFKLHQSPRTIALKQADQYLDWPV